MTRGALAVILACSTALIGQTREGFVSVPGARLFFRDLGGPGIPVIFLHAASGNTDSWEKQTAAFRDAGDRVIAYDRRGWGKSTDQPGSTEPWTATGDLLAVIQHLQLQRVHLVGTALGGFVAFDFAISHPELLRTVVIASSLGGFQDPELVTLNSRLRPKGLMEMPAEFYELGPMYRAAHPEGVERWLEHEKNSRHDRQTKTPLDHRLTLSLLDGIEIPFLLLTGGADLLAPPAMQKIFASHLKKAEIEVIPNAGHSVFWEDPDAFNRSVIRFLREH
jgi:pimeloyl-ACP methyl ester carboxylesterase